MKTTSLIHSYYFLLFACSLFLSSASAQPTWVGNGDDGSDLEGSEKIQTGILIETKKEALALLDKLNPEGIHGLGLLRGELESDKLYLAKKNVSPVLTEDQGSFHSDMNGLVYARTQAIPHAATRFFPASLKLTQKQLISLHIHEALHRALPVSVREDESKVSAITLAMTAPEATHDQIQSVTSKLLPEQDEIKLTQAQKEAAVEIPESALVKNPSLFGYTYRSFLDSKADSLLQVESMHSIQSYLYPFGSDRVPLGIGIEASLLNRQSGTELGPLGLSARLRFWTFRGFDFDAFTNLSLNTLSAEELKNSALGRDLIIVGLGIRKDLNLFYFQNDLSFNFPGTANETIGTTQINYEYGSIIQAKVRAGLTRWGFSVGGYAQLDLADYFRMTQANASYDTGRYRIVSGGPEIEYRTGNLGLSLQGKLLINSTKDADFDTLGNLLGSGSAQGSIGGSLRVYF